MKIDFFCIWVKGEARQDVEGDFLAAAAYELWHSGEEFVSIRTGFTRARVTILAEVISINLMIGVVFRAEGYKGDKEYVVDFFVHKLRLIPEYYQDPALN